MEDLDHTYNMNLKILNEVGASYSAFGCVPISDFLKNKPTYS